MPTLADPILSNNTFLDSIPERTWGTPETADYTAATTLNLEAAAEPTVLSGLVQPTVPSKVKITVTDANASIDAFQIDVAGTDVNGKSITETFVFAGGLVQTGTKVFASVTSVTFTSGNGNAAGDTLAVQYVAETIRLIPVLDGDYGVALDDPLREQEHHVGDPEAQFMVQTGRRLAGDLKMGFWPHQWRTMLDFAMKRYATDSSIMPRNLPSRTFRYTTPGLETVRHFGCRCERLVIEGSQDGDLMMTVGLVGWYEDNNGAAILSYPGSYVVPGIASLQMKSCAFVISLNAGTNFANRINPVGMESFTLTVENNLRPGPFKENRITVEKDGAIAFLLSGRKKLSLRYRASFTTDDYSIMQRKRYRTQFKLMGAHPDYTSYGTTAGAEAAGSTVEVELTADPSAWLSVGDVVMFDNAGLGNRPCVGIVTAINAGTPSIVIDVLDEAVASGDHVFPAAIELKTAPALVGTLPKTRPFNDFVTVEVNAEAFSSGADPLTVKAKDNALAA